MNEDDMVMVRYTRAHAGAVGHNEYGLPLHACWGYRHDAHYWDWVASWCGDGSGTRPLPKEPATWGASHVTHPAYIAEQREKNQRARDVLDGMDPKEPA